MRRQTVSLFQNLFYRVCLWLLLDKTVFCNEKIIPGSETPQKQPAKR